MTAGARATETRGCRLPASAADTAPLAWHLRTLFCLSNPVMQFLALDSGPAAARDAQRGLVL